MRLGERGVATIVIATPRRSTLELATHLGICLEMDTRVEQCPSLISRRLISNEPLTLPSLARLPIPFVTRSGARRDAAVGFARLADDYAKHEPGRISESRGVSPRVAGVGRRVYGRRADTMLRLSRVCKSGVSPVTAVIPAKQQRLAESTAFPRAHAPSLFTATISYRQMKTFHCLSQGTIAHNCRC